MKIPGLVNTLNAKTDIPFTEFAWSEAPGGSYGVVTLSGQEVLRADEDPVAEKMRTGYVDVFVKATDADPTESVESAMKSIGLWFRMESIQFEPETGYMHFEWSWSDTLGSACTVYTIEFWDDDGGILSREPVPKSCMPEAPVVDDYNENGIYHNFDGWIPEVGPALRDQRYDAHYYIAMQIDNTQWIENVDYTAFTEGQQEYIEQQFNAGMAVKAYDPQADQWYVPEIIQGGLIYVNGHWCQFVIED